MKRKRRTQVFPPVPRIFEPSEKKKKHLTKTKKQNKKKYQKIQTNKKKQAFNFLSIVWPVLFFSFFLLYIYPSEKMRARHF